MTPPSSYEYTEPCPEGHEGAAWVAKQIEPGGTRYELVGCRECGDPCGVEADPQPPVQQLSSIPVSLAKNALYLMQLALQRRTA